MKKRWLAGRGENYNPEIHRIAMGCRKEDVALTTLRRWLLLGDDVEAGAGLAFVEEEPPKRT